MRRALPILCAICVFALPVLALAADDDTPVDPRVQGYAQKLEMGGSTGLSWLLFIGLCILCLIILFKNPRRTHLD